MGEGVWAISYWELTLRIMMAVIAGGAVGLEREWSNRAAGFRTHILVCVGAAAIMLLSIYGFASFVNEENVRMDPARLSAQVISGIGFLGAGAIMRSGFTISGLTTAASLWVVAAIGLCIGAGFYFVSILTTGVLLFSLLLLNKWEQRFFNIKRTYKLKLKISSRNGQVSHLLQLFKEKGIVIMNMSIDKVQDITEIRTESHDVPVHITLTLKHGDEKILAQIVDYLLEHPDILSFSTGNNEGRMRS